MSTKTEEFLYVLLWACEMMTHPTWRNLDESFEGWAYRKGWLRRLQRLERQQMLEQSRNPRGERLHRLTDKGRLCALGGRDPAACWSRPWDGTWRLVLYDVPQASGRLRDRVRLYLQRRGFGYLQNSAWICPHSVELERDLLAGSPVDVESLIILAARPCAGETNEQIVSAAWDFADLNQRYDRYQNVLARHPQGEVNTAAAAQALHRWLAEERLGWLDVLSHDPLLPECLWPAGYAGRKIWEHRLAVMAEVGMQIRAFRLEV